MKNVIYILEKELKQLRESEQRLKRIISEEKRIGSCSPEFSLSCTNRLISILLQITKFEQAIKMCQGLLYKPNPLLCPYCNASLIQRKIGFECTKCEYVNTII